MVDRAAVNTRTPGPAAQTAWKQYNLMTARATQSPTANGTAAVAQSPWPVLHTQKAPAAASTGRPADQATGTLVSATFVETARESAVVKASADTPAVVSADSKSPTVTTTSSPATAPTPASSTTLAKSAPPPPPRSVPGVVESATVLPPPEPPMMPSAQAAGAEVVPASAIVPQTPSGPSVRMVNSKRINLNYELKDVGESGISAIELWYTQDTRTWKRYEGPVQKQAPYVVEVNGEGLYGFTMVARSGVGYSRELPQPGELPQVWVEVDLTQPSVQVTAVELNSTPKAQNLTICWTASDKNLTARPITLSYAEKPEGPWTPIAANLENSGKHEWPVPASVPKRIYVKVEASDLVGHMGAAQTQHTVLIDRARPAVSILTVDSDKKDK